MAHRDRLYGIATAKCAAEDEDELGSSPSFHPNWRKECFAQRSAARAREKKCIAQSKSPGRGRGFPDAAVSDRAYWFELGGLGGAVRSAGIGFLLGVADGAGVVLGAADGAGLVGVDWPVVAGG